MARDSRYVTNTGYSGAESLVISRFRCTTGERLQKSERTISKTYYEVRSTVTFVNENESTGCAESKVSVTVVLSDEENTVPVWVFRSITDPSIVLSTTVTLPERSDVPVLLTTIVIPETFSPVYVNCCESITRAVELCTAPDPPSIGFSDRDSIGTATALPLSTTPARRTAQTGIVPGRRILRTVSSAP